MPGQATSGEFYGLDWRALNAALGKVNLNRNLAPYQRYDSTLKAWVPRDVNQATIDRQQFAADVFIRLITVTGVYDLSNPTSPPTQPQFDALRLLAQLSANIVDLVESDDIVTPF